MDTLRIVKWTFWGDLKYPEVKWVSEEMDRPYELAVIEAIRQKGYRFTGEAHQRTEYGTPVMSDGKQYSISMRHWGRLMAEALGLEGQYAYVTWAWYPPEEPMVFPDPIEWNQYAEESAEHKERWMKHAAECLIEECGGEEELGLLRRFLKERTQKIDDEICDSCSMM